MEQDTITNVWVEGQIHSDGVSLSLLSESREGGARVEAVENLTFEELESREGGLFNMGLSDETQSAFGETNRLAQVGKLFEESEPQVSEGDVLTDENAPHWSSDDWVEVVEVLSDVTADRYVIEGPNAGPVPEGMPLHFHDSTVAEANPSYPEDDAVIIAQYAGTGKHYAFPESRLA